jgi:hypothetical protein
LQISTVVPIPLSLLEMAFHFPLRTVVSRGWHYLWRQWGCANVLFDLRSSQALVLALAATRLQAWTMRTARPSSTAPLTRCTATSGASRRELLTGVSGAAAAVVALTTLATPALANEDIEVSVDTVSSLLDGVQMDNSPRFILISNHRCCTCSWAACSCRSRTQEEAGAS